MFFLSFWGITLGAPIFGISALLYGLKNHVGTPLLAVIVPLAGWFVFTGLTILAFGEAWSDSQTAASLFAPFFYLSLASGAATIAGSVWVLDTGIRKARKAREGETGPPSSEEEAGRSRL